MYASQTKRLCVREATSDESRVQHRSTASSENATTESIHILPSSSLSSTTQSINQQQVRSQTTTLPQNTCGFKSKAATSNLAGEIIAGEAGQENEYNMTASATGNATDGDNRSAVKTTTTANSTRDCTPTLQNQHQHNRDSNHQNNIISEVTEQELIKKLSSETKNEVRLELLLSMRNLITACNKKKDSLTSNPNFSKLIHLLDDETQTSSSVKTQLALLLCSLAKSGEHNVRILSNLNVSEKIFNLILTSKDDVLIEACLRCLRSIMSWPSVSRTWILYDNGITGDAKLSLQKIIQYAQNSHSYIVQECVAEIFAATCRRPHDQTLLNSSGAMQCIVHLLESPSNRVIVTSLSWLTSLCLKNPSTSLEAVKADCSSDSRLLDRLTRMMMKDECQEIQFFSARCYTTIYRALAPEYLGNDSRVVTHVLPTLVRMVHRDKLPQLRSSAAESIAYLIEREPRLQSTASICDHLVESLASMLEHDQNILFSDHNYANHTSYIRECKSTRRHLHGYQQQTAQVFNISRNDTDSARVDSIPDGSCELYKDMRRAAFLALAALAANLEPIRKKIFNTCTVMQHLVKSLTDNDTETLKSVLTCLLSLSRSVQQLRTSFSENSVYSALKGLLTTSSNEVLILVLAVLCNISLDFSPGKQHFLDSTTISTLCSLTRGRDQELRLHGMWILMNMVYQLKDQTLKFQILRTLGPEHVLNILETDEDEALVLKTLGFLRNLLSQKLHIDAIMNNHGDQIMQSLVRVLERQCSTRVKEQALCVLTNIADGTDSKVLLMNNRVILAHLARTICDENAGDMRLAAICCVTNLAHKDQEGSFDRRNEMKKFGIEEKLKSMLNTCDPILSDRVRTAYNQFLIGIEDKYVN